MKLYSSNKNYKLYHGNMLDMLDAIEKESIDSIVTDPPYGLTSITKRFGKENSAKCQYGRDGSFQKLSKGFMGKEWDGSGIEYNVDAWKQCYEVLKPGGYLLAFGGSRTCHRIACAIEDAGFEIRDTIMWLYGSGFPKSMNIGLAIDKKNDVESDIMGIAKREKEETHTNSLNMVNSDFGGEYEIKKAKNDYDGWGTALKPSFEPIIVARKPFKGSCVDNVIKYGVGGINIDECRVEMTQKDKIQYFEKQKGRFPANTILDSQEGEEWRRYFYTPKASKKDRDEGLDEFEIKGAKELLNREENSDGASWNGKYSSGNAYAGAGCPKKNTHPTVKPTELMQYLVRLVSPKGATILDPFNGSGSTGKAVMYENKERNKNYKYIGIELTEEYLPIAKARIEYVCNLPIEKDNQLTIFDFIGEDNE